MYVIGTAGHVDHGKSALMTPAPRLSEGRGRAGLKTCPYGRGKAMYVIGTAGHVDHGKSALMTPAPRTEACLPVGMVRGLAWRSRGRAGLKTCPYGRGKAMHTIGTAMAPAPRTEVRGLGAGRSKDLPLRAG